METKLLHYVAMEVYHDGGGDSFADIISQFSEKGERAYCIYGHSPYFDTGAIMFITQKVSRRLADKILTARLCYDYGCQDELEEAMKQHV